jgi:hypothetical protein
LKISHGFQPSYSSRAVYNPVRILALRQDERTLCTAYNDLKSRTFDKELSIVEFQLVEAHEANPNHDKKDVTTDQILELFSLKYNLSVARAARAVLLGLGTEHVV